MLRVYVAGAYNSDNVISVLDNMRVGIDKCIELLMDYGFAPFCPWLDFTYGLKRHIPIEVYKTYSLAWLRGSDATFFLPGWQNSPGSVEEHAEAIWFAIPTFELITDLLNWRDTVIRMVGKDWKDMEIRRVNLIICGEVKGEKGGEGYKL